MLDLWRRSNDWWAYFESIRSQVRVWDRTQKTPLYLNSSVKKNLKINSIKKPRDIKYDALLCANCNNARTAPFDKAWEAMSRYLRCRSDLREGGIIRLEKVFPGKTKENMLNIHLFFAKLFGCAIEDPNVPIDITGFSDAIFSRSDGPRRNAYRSMDNRFPVQRVKS